MRKLPERWNLLNITCSSISYVHLFKHCFVFSTTLDYYLGYIFPCLYARWRLDQISEDFRNYNLLYYTKYRIHLNISTFPVFVSCVRKFLLTLEELVHVLWWWSCHKAISSNGRKLDNFKKWSRKKKEEEETFFPSILSFN